MSVIGREGISRMIPHQGAMCLLDEVLEWDDVWLRGLSRRAPGVRHPMRRADGVLGMACGIEIAAQAMAVHGRLGGPHAGQPTAAGAPVQGYLASVRDVRLCFATLDEHQGDLITDVTRLAGDVRSAAYRFTLACEGRELLSGRATVLFVPGA